MGDGQIILMGDGQIILMGDRQIILMGDGQIILMGDGQIILMDTHEGSSAQATLLPLSFFGPTPFFHSA